MSKKENGLMKKLHVEDNFLGQKEFDTLQTHMMGNNFTWNYNTCIDYEGQQDKFQFNHVFYIFDRPTNKYFELLKPLLEIINPISLLRIKANLLTRTPNIVENEFHVDLGLLSEEKVKQWTTSIFYINTNNGYTKFENGTKVESVANRLITFPANIKHKGTSCTNENTRVVINFNYYRM